MSHEGVIVDSDEPRAPDVSNFEDFYNARLERSLRLAHLITGSAAIGQEVVQDAFLAVHSKWAAITNHEAYLRSSVVNRSRSVIRRQMRERSAFRRLPVVGSSIPDVDEMWAAIRKLSVEQRAVLVLRYYEDLALAEIAVVLGKPVGTIKSTLHRAIARLKETL